VHEDICVHGLNAQWHLAQKIFYENIPPLIFRLERRCLDSDLGCWGLRVRVMWSGIKPNGTMAMEWCTEVSDMDKAL